MVPNSAGIGAPWIIAAIFAVPCPLSNAGLHEHGCSSDDSMGVPPMIQNGPQVHICSRENYVLEKIDFVKCQKTGFSKYTVQATPGDRAGGLATGFRRRLGGCAPDKRPCRLAEATGEMGQ